MGAMLATGPVRYMPADPLQPAAAGEFIAERLSMRREAYLIQDIWFEGERGDTAIYALLTADWRAAHAA